MVMIVLSVLLLHRIISEFPDCLTPKFPQQTTTTAPLQPTSYLVIADPINWTETHIEAWLASVEKKFDLLPAVDAASLPTSGPELCSLTQSDWVSLAGTEAGVLLYKYLVCLREPFTGEKFLEPTVPLPSYLPRTKRPSSSSSTSSSCCSTSSLPLSALSPAASLSSSNSVLSGKI